MLHSELLASLNFNKSYNLVPWIGQKSYIEKMFQQFFKKTMYVRVVGKIQDQHFNVVVLKSRGQGQKKMEKEETNMSPSFNKNQDLVPWIGGKQCIKILVQHFPINISKYGCFLIQGTRF